MVFMSQYLEYRLFVWRFSLEGIGYPITKGVQIKPFSYCMNESLKGDKIPTLICMPCIYIPPKKCPSCKPYKTLLGAEKLCHLHGRRIWEGLDAGVEQVY